jgi:hypothetical protein
MDLIFTYLCCGCLILNMMFARFKFVVKRYCVHTCYKSRSLSGHSVCRELCVVALFKYIHWETCKFVYDLCTRSNFHSSLTKLAKFTLALEMHINWCYFVRVGKKTGRFAYHVVYVITVISWLSFCLCDYCD